VQALPMWQLSPSGSPMPLTDANIVALDEAILRLEASGDPTGELPRLRARRDDAAGRLANLRALHADAPEIARKEDIYGDNAFYRRGAPMTISQSPGECAVLGARSPGMEKVKAPWQPS